MIHIMSRNLTEIDRNSIGIRTKIGIGIEIQKAQSNLYVPKVRQGTKQVMTQSPMSSQHPSSPEAHSAGGAAAPSAGGCPSLGGLMDVL